MNFINSKYKILLIGLALILIGVGGFFAYKAYSKTDLTVEEQTKKEADAVKKGLGKHLILPEGDEPDIRKINQKLEDPFFANAVIGDYLIIFYKSRIAYIYSPDRDIITNAGVVFVNPQQATTTKR
ncbi:MAG: hypothetical protein V4686_03350 [Patescibacteria group bacterium]